MEEVALLKDGHDRVGWDALVLLAHDRFVAACLRFDPLLYAGFNLPRGHTRLLFVRRMRKIDRALC